jgi:hypothetical protein
VQYLWMLERAPEKIRGVPVLDESASSASWSQADLAWAGPQKDVAVLVREVSRGTDLPSR